MNQDYNNTMKDEGTPQLPPPSMDVLLGRIEDLNKELQNTTQEFSYKITLLTDQVNDLKHSGSQRSNQEQAHSSPIEGEEHEYNQNQELLSNRQNSSSARPQTEDIQKKKKHEKDVTPSASIDKAFLPNILQFTSGLLHLTAAAAIIFQNQNIIHLFDNLIALILIAEVENIAVSLVSHSYFCDQIKDDHSANGRTKSSKLVRFFVCFVIFASMVGCWSYFVPGPIDRLIFKLENPECKVENLKLIGDGYCNGGEYNTKECLYDGGDCEDFNHFYPNCKVEHPEFIGDGKCDSGDYYTPECYYDEGDCHGFQMKYPGCTLGRECDAFRQKYPNCNVTNPENIGDGFCDGGQYYTPECGYEEGDCLIFYEEYSNCTVDEPELIGNNYCDGGKYNTQECMYDGGDCEEFNDKYPDCHVENPIYIGNGYCDGGEYNTPECGYEEGDCLVFEKKFPDCKVEEPGLIGNGKCDYGEYNKPECGFDGGDCKSYASVLI